MPNGRSGGFIIETSDLKRLIAAVPPPAVVGRVTTGGSLRDVTAAETLQQIDQCQLDGVVVEEQDKTFYVIHLSDQPNIIWVTVSPQSSIFGELQQRHSRWATEHPGWKGWMGF